MDPRAWRSAAARVSATLATAIDRVMAMDWDEMIRWHEEARTIDAETWGLFRRSAE